MTGKLFFFYKSRVNDVLVFQVGGTTYEEARALSLLAEDTGSSIVLGSTCVHNSKSLGGGGYSRRGLPVCVVLKFQ